MGKGGGGEGRSLAETPTWALATVVSAMVALGFFFHGSLKQLGKWLDRTKRKALLAALEKIKEELMVFGLLSLLMGHWIIFVAKICVKSSALSSRFYPCLSEADTRESVSSNATVSSSSMHLNHSLFHEQLDNMQRHFCPQGHESFALYESLKQLHRFLFALGVTHVFYSFAAIALAMIKIYSWKTWENQAKSVALSESQGNPEAASNSIRMRRLSTFIFLHTSHPWSQHRILVWLLCFGRQFWSSIYRADYMALRLGFITTHQLPLSYDFHNYMFRSMEEEFRDIVGISVPLWIFGILCIFLDFHVVKLAVEIMDRCQLSGVQCFNLRDELFWFGRPRLLLLLIQFISFQNAFEMATFVWSLWESKGTSCFMENRSYIVIRLTFGLVSQFWCSFITFPLYVIVTQMGSRFKKSIVSENVRKSLHGWQRRVRAKHGSSSFTFLNTTTSTLSLDLSVDEIEKMHTVGPSSMEERSSRSHEDLSDTLGLSEISASEETIQTVPCYDSSNENSTLW